MFTDRNDSENMFNRYIFYLVGICILIGILIIRNNKRIEKEIEKFTALRGISSPLTTYDDYGTFNFLLSTNDLPYYDPTYEDLQMTAKDYNPKGQKRTCKLNAQRVTEDFCKDSFIDFEGFKVRRELVPENYSKHAYMDANFDKNQLHLVIKKDRPRLSSNPPQPVNIYFNKT